MLNSSDKSVWRVVCNDLDVRNGNLSAAIKRAIVEVRNPTATICILGAPGCGKTTQMNRTAVDFALSEYPVIMINAHDLDASIQPVDYEEYFRKIYALQMPESRSANIARCSF